MSKSPAFRYHGGKFRLSPWIQKHFPAHTTYVESFGGAAGVLLTKPRSYAEVYNDLDGDVVNLFRVLQDQTLRDRLIESCALTPYSREEFNLSWSPADDPVERARRLLIRAQMGFGSAGASACTTGFRSDSQRAYATASHLWAKFPDGLTAVADRFRGVIVENRPAIQVMRQHDTSRTLHYIDPPYVHSTRVMQRGKAGYYRYEMDEAAHHELLASISELSGMVVLSGYRCQLYDDALCGWTRYETSSRISAGRGTKTRTECIWLNEMATSGLEQQRLIA